MKKIFAGVVLPTLAAVAVIGSGFSVWFFGENQDKVSTDASIAVENMIRIGNLTMNASNLKLRLDQTKGVRDFILNPANGYVSAEKDGNAYSASNYYTTAFGAETKTNGLYLTGDTGFDGRIVYDKTAFEEQTGAWTYEIVTKFTFTGKISEYVGMNVNQATTKGSWTTDTSVAGSVSYKFKWNNNELPKMEMLLPVNDDTNGDFKFEYLKYNNQYTSGADTKRNTYSGDHVMNTAEPHNHNEYIALRGIALTTTNNLKIETTATIVADTTTGA